MLRELLTGLTRIAGVRGALIVSGKDGIVVAETVMEGVDGRAVAALTGSLAARMRGVTGALGHTDPGLLHLQGPDGGLFAAAGRAGLLVVALTTADVNAGELRLALLRAAERAA